MDKRVALPPDAYYAPVDGGVYFLSNRGSARLTGASIAEWVDRLAPHLDGRYTAGELTGHLPPERREMVERILHALRSRGLLRDHGDDGPSPLGDPEAAQYAHEITFLESFRDGARAAFARYRDYEAVVVGTGEMLPAVTRALQTSGLRTVRVADGTTDEAELARLVDGAGLVVQVGDRSEVDAGPLERACASGNVAMAQVVVDDRQAWVVPVTRSGAPRWASAEPRLRPPQPPVAPYTGPDGHGPAATTVVASHLVQGAFRALAGAGEAADHGQVTLIDLDTLRSEQRRFLAHPFALPARPRTESEFRQRVQELASGEHLTEEAFSRRAARCIDDRFGVVTLHEHDWAQRPLHITEARAYPVGVPGRRTGPVVTAADLTYQGARVRATMRAMVHYAARTVDARRLVDATGRPLVDQDSEPHRAVVTLLADQSAAATWGCEVTHPDRVRLVPAESVFPAILSKAPAGVTTGLAAGHDWDDAVRAGLLDHSRAVTLAEVAQRTTAYPVADVADVPLDLTGQFCRDLLAQIGEAPTVYDVTGSLRIPTYAFCLGQRTVAYVTADSVPTALTDGFVEVLRAVLARMRRQPAVAPPAVPDVPSSLRARTGPATTVDPTYTCDMATVAARLRETGRVGVAVPLDHDPQLSEIMPYLVHVVMCDD